jgi:EAL domain-containing protein (putative c-di-GMP-specific phosphodiesterase class I)
VTWQLLAKLGCDLCQGFFSAKPMPRSELQHWHRTWQDRLPTLLSI